MDTDWRRHLRRTLAEPGVRAPRAWDDAARLFGRAMKLASIASTHEEVDAEAIELACWALQLVPKGVKSPGRSGAPTLRDRAEQAGESLAGQFAEAVDGGLLDRAVRLLSELPRRDATLAEAKLLADAVNLDDFGIGGLVNSAMRLATAGEGLSQVVDGAAKREAYGYWEARMKDGFHYGASSKLAAERLATARRVVTALRKELEEDRSDGRA